jgi:hypothetical protein
MGVNGCLPLRLAFPVLFWQVIVADCICPASVRPSAFQVVVHLLSLLLWRSSGTDRRYRDCITKYLFHLIGQ